jgi:hypothetical protein
MPYAHRRMHDADAHVMETPDWLLEHADPEVRDALPPIYLSTVKPGEERMLDTFRARHADPGYRAEDEAKIMLRKNWAATGSFVAEDRPRALDLLGFESQLVFNTFLNGKLLAAERGDDVDLAYGFARSHNRAMVAFCSVDPRLLPTGYVPLRDFERSKSMASEAIKMGEATDSQTATSSTSRISRTAVRPFRTSMEATRTSARWTTWRFRRPPCRPSRR